MNLFSTIICCINVSESSEDIITYTKEIMKKDTKVILAYVASEASHLINQTDLKIAYGDLMKKREERILAFLSKIKEKHFATCDTKQVVLEGDVSEDILKLADDECADIIVIGSMSTKPWFSFLFSNTSSKLTGKSRIPLMIIPNSLDFECLPPEEMDEKTKQSLAKSFQHTK